MMLKETDSRREQLFEVARQMMTAARTAPKACGIDELDIVALSEDDIKRLSDEMHVAGKELGRDFFHRDAENVANSDAVVLIGMHNTVRKLNCGLCGFEGCRDKAERAPLTPCSFIVTDLGIAVGSAVSVAADHRVDNRVMYSAGVAAQRLGMLEECMIIYAIPLSCTGKSIYFDRAAKSCSK